MNLKLTSGGNLISASQENDLNMAKYLIFIGANIHEQDDEALIIASVYGHLDIVKYLIANGANIHAQNDKALITASMKNLDLVKFLVLHGADIHAQDDEAIFIASQYGRIQIVKYLIEQGANVRAQNDRLLISLSLNGHLDLVKYVISKGANVHAFNNILLDNPLINASSSGKLNVVEYLIANGANIHAQNDKAVILASVYNHTNTVKYLISIYRTEGSWNPKGSIESRILNDVLINACNFENLDLISYLISAGADINVVPLICASRRGYLNIVEFLVLHDVNIHAQDDEALIEASRNGCIEIVKYLLSVGANIHAQDSKALNSNSPDVVIYLVNNGADVNKIKLYKEYKDIMIHLYHLIELCSWKEVSIIYDLFRDRYDLSNNIFLRPYIRSNVILGLSKQILPNDISRNISMYL